MRKIHPQGAYKPPKEVWVSQTGFLSAMSLRRLQEHRIQVPVINPDRRIGKKLLGATPFLLELPFFKAGITDFP